MRNCVPKENKLHLGWIRHVVVINSFFDSHTYRPIHGFDSFRGLHEVWGGKGSTISRNYPIGRFDDLLGNFFP